MVEVTLTKQQKEILERQLKEKKAQWKILYWTSIILIAPSTFS